MKLLFLFCTDLSVDPLAPFLWNQAKHDYNASHSMFMVEGKPVFQAQINGHQLFFAETNRFASAIYPEIADDLNFQFSDVDMIGLVNWHAGANAPAKIFCAHSTADVPSGVFGPTSGRVLTAILLALENERNAADLVDFRILFEASHWSGTMYGRQSNELLQVRAPVFDIEIGSYPEDWNHPEAQKAFVRALGRIPEFYKPDRIRALYLGGTHFEPSATEIAFQGVAIEHHLPNQWLVSGEYNQSGGVAKLVAAAKSCTLPPQLFVYHAGLKSAYKENARQAAASLGIPCLSHKQLRLPDWQQTIL